MSTIQLFACAWYSGNYLILSRIRPTTSSILANDCSVGNKELMYSTGLKSGWSNASVLGNTCNEIKVNIWWTSRNISNSPVIYALLLSLISINFWLARLLKHRTTFGSSFEEKPLLLKKKSYARVSFWSHRNPTIGYVFQFPDARPRTKLYLVTPRAGD